MTKRIIVLTSLVFACVAEAKLNSCDMDAVYQVVTNRLLVQTRVSDAVTYAERLERRNGVSREMMTDALERAIKELHTDEETSYRANLRWMAVRLFSELAPQQRIEMLARLAETESNYCARTAFEGYYRRKTDSEGLALAARLLGRHKSPGVMRGAVWSVLSEEAEHELTEERQSQLRTFAERCLESADDVVDADRLLMYGYTDNDKADISYGDVYGVWYSTTNRLDSGTNVAEKVWHLSPAPVGFHFHGKRTLP